MRKLIIIVSAVLLLSGCTLKFANDPEGYTNDLGMKFVYIPAGKFMMGSPPDEIGRNSDEHLHLVELTKSFYLQTTEVTQTQWLKVMKSHRSPYKGADLPVSGMFWQEVQEYIQKLNELDDRGIYRLPTEAEWEYACRAGTQSHYSSGKCLSAEAANFKNEEQLPGCPEETTIRAYEPMPVASFPPNAWGLNDMHGNVNEWCEDWYDKYRMEAVIDPVVDDKPAIDKGHVHRGGSYLARGELCRSANRFHSENSGSTFPNIGFRLVWVPVSKKKTKQTSAAGTYDKKKKNIKEINAFRIRSLDHRRDGNSDKALSELNKGLKRYPLSASLFIDRANLMAEAGQFDSAMDDLERAIKLEPDNFRAYFERACLYEKRNQFEQAIQDFSKSYELEPSYSNSLYKRGLIHKKMGNLELALEDMTQVLQISPKHPDPLKVRAKIYEKIQDYRRAIEDYTSLIELKHGTPVIYISRGFSWSMLGDKDKAMNDFKEAIKLDPKNALGHLNCGAIYLKKGQPQAALLSFDRAILHSSQERAIFYYSRGEALRHLRRYKQAIQDFDKAVLLRPNYWEAYNSRGIAKSGIRDDEGALADYNKALSIDPDNRTPYIYSNRGNVLIRMSEYDRAISDYNKALSIQKYANAYCGRGFAWYYKKEYEKAIADFETALSMYPWYGTACSMLARIYAMCPVDKYRHGARAVILAERGVQLNATAFALDTLAAAYAEDGRFDNAVATQKAAISKAKKEKDPDLKNMQERLASYRAEKPWRE
jgi:tetratricopeptide (TPR) repeat protein